MNFKRPQVLASLELEACQRRNAVAADEERSHEIGILISEFAQLAREKSELLIVVRTALAILGAGDGSAEQGSLIAAMRESVKRVTR